ncbi:MAG: hypothetical protein KBF99_04225 [Leptospiraceae bacterium]|nr:hypothetical protein [Leptospiraceae bacterium]MBK7054649.1 hypothetical protein [Leptospiraceae bacterium]MBK9502971.1 hypothetical protein [Leptospiraceae bacterium]MBL0264633.1 hypothetical protein [Leptospiraceae bacterium]MBP9162361.1 hypothetical protein [Leptospiraceae bacterium]
MKTDLVKDNQHYIILDEELMRPIPNFRNIEEAISNIPPAILSMAILEDVGFTYLIDYYLRHMDVQIVKKILQNPMFSHDALVELFYCQVTAYHKAILQKKPLPEMVSSYWTTLSKAEYAILFKNLISRTSSIQVTKTILSKVDLVYLRMMTSSGSLKSDRVLNFLKKLGPEIQKLAAQDMNIYDYAFDLAVANSDDDFLAFLDEYTVVFVQLRLVSSFVEEIEAEMKRNSGNKLPYFQILQISANIPMDCLKLSLEVFQERGWINANENKAIQEYCNNAKS